MHYLNKQSYIRVAAVLSVGLLVAGIFAPKVFGQAQNAGFNLSTTPVVANLQAKPGVATSTKVQVKNNNLAAERIKVSLLKFGSNNVDGAPQMVDVDPNDEFLSWVKFSESNFVAEPNVWKTIDVTITPPSTAAFGYYYAIIFSRDNEAQSAGTPTNLTASIAVPILLDVEAPGAIRKADITQFSVNKNVFEFLPAKFAVKLRNSGNTHVAPRGNIFITKGGKNVGMLEVNQAKSNILPDSNREYTAEWADGSPVYKLKEVDGKVVLDKKGQQTYSLIWDKFDPSKVRFGKYHAKIALVYDDGTGDVAVESEVDFWVIPWRIIGVSLLVLLLVGAGLWATILRPLRSRIKNKLPTKKQKITNQK